MRWLAAVVLVLLGLTQWGLWLGQGSLPQVWSLRSQLQEQQAQNAQARARNARTNAEVTDLKEGMEIVEEQARSALGMIKPDEILVQVAPKP